MDKKHPVIPKEEYIKLDEFAKSLGITIYDITIGFMYEGKEYKHGISGFNVPPQEDVPEFKGFVECLKSENNRRTQAD